LSESLDVLLVCHFKGAATPPVNAALASSRLSSRSKLGRLVWAHSLGHQLKCSG
jgi:hypothetical protein